jgi:hypothetical protein
MKKLIKNIIYAITTLFFTANYAQVGINTTSPNAALDVVSTTNGMLLPRVALTTTTLAAPVVNPAGGALPASTLVYNTNTAGDVTPGYYYWSGSAWLRLNTGSGGSGGGWLLTGNNVTDANHFLGTTNWMSLKLKASNTLLGVFEPNGSVFFGVNASGSTNNAFVFGPRSQATASESFALGQDVISEGWRSFGIGTSARARSSNSMAIGWGANTGNSGSASIAIGQNATTNANAATSIGRNSSASGDDSMSIGYNSNSTTSQSLALGASSVANGVGSTALGNSATSSGLYSTAIGYQATTSQARAIVLGNSADASVGVGIGTNSPNAKLHIVSSASSGFQYQDGNEANGKVLTSDADGKATWKNLGNDQAIGEILKASDSSLNSGQIALGTSNVNINVSNYSNYIQVTKAGLYKVTYHVNLQKNATAGLVSGYFYLTNWGTEWANTRSYFSINTNENTSVSISRYINLTAWQSVSLYSSIGDSNVNVLANGTFISVEFVR